MRFVDTETQWRGRRDTRTRRLIGLLAVSALLHAFLTPWPALLGLVGWLTPFEPEGPKEEVNAIPVEILPAETPEPPPEPAEPVEDSEPEPEPVEEATQPEPPPPEPEPAKPPETPKPTPPPEAKTEDDGGIGDPVALSGTAGDIADANANVRLMLYNEEVRKHPLGARIGQLLSHTPQWRDFFGPAQIDPIRDIDRVLVAGPQLRDSSNVVAVVAHHLPEERIARGLEALVNKGGGEWLAGKAKVARARADRAERLFVIPGDGLVAVVPPSAEKAALALGPETQFPPGPPGVAVQAYLITPWRVFIGLPISVPKSIQWVRIEVRPTDDGGGVARIVAQDASEEDAEKNALALERLIQAATEVDFGELGPMGAVASFMFGSKKHKVIEKVSLRGESDRIVGTIAATGKQLSALADLLGTVLQFQDSERAARARARQAAVFAKPPERRREDRSGAASPKPEPSSERALSRPPSPGREVPPAQAEAPRALPHTTPDGARGASPAQGPD